MTPRVQVVGICRYSYHDIGGVQGVPDDPETRAQAHYDSARLDARFAWFTKVTHPTLRARTGGDFTLVVLTGADFPQIDRRRSVLADLPQAKLVQMPPCHRDAAADAIRAALQPDATVGAQIRMDDGDGVARDCVATSRAAWRRSSAHRPGDGAGRRARPCLGPHPATRCGRTPSRHAACPAP